MFEATQFSCVAAFLGLSCFCPRTTVDDKKKSCSVVVLSLPSSSQIKSCRVSSRTELGRSDNIQPRESFM